MFGRCCNAATLQKGDETMATRRKKKSTRSTVTRGNTRSLEVRQREAHERADLIDMRVEASKLKSEIRAQRIRLRRRVKLII